MFDSNLHHVEEIFTDDTRPSVETSKPDPEDIERKTINKLRINALSCYFVRMSFDHKLTFLTELSQRIRSLRTITILINTLYSITGKIKSYSLVSTNHIIFDKISYDHHRMFNAKMISECVTADLQWYETLNDREQVAYLIILYRNSGGVLRCLFYERLQKIYSLRLREMCDLEDTILKAEDNKKGKKTEVLESKEDGDPKQQKVRDLTKTWNDTIATMRKNLEKKALEPKKPKKGKEGKKSKTKKSKTENQPLDWIQLMPIPIIKKIFNYLDRKTLIQATKVNEFWKWAISELLKDRKAQTLLFKATRKLKSALRGSYALPDDTTLKPRISQTQRRVKKLEQRGAILEKLRLTDMEANHASSVFLEAVKDSGLSWYAQYLTMFPTVLRTKPLMEKKPRYIVKDVNLICETQDDSSEEEDFTTSYSSSVSSSRK